MNISNNLKRKLIQIAAFGFSNSHPGNFALGKIYTGHWKQFCNPGLNCYSCPASSLACPIGALQAVSGSMDFKFSFYVIGFLLAAGVFLGRIVCGFLCPFGFIQELLNKIPGRKFKVPRPLLYIKYVILIVFVILMPVVLTNYMGIGKPAFCQFICPAGTLEGGIPLLSMHDELRQTIGSLFSLKLTILIITIIGCVLSCRFFCKTLCPLAVIYGLLNKISFYHLNINEYQCVHCGKCARTCKMNVDPVKHPNSVECIRCGECAEVCPTKAISLGFRSERKKAENVEQIQNTKEESDYYE